MIEKTVIDYLRETGLSVGQQVYAEKPLDPPAEYVLVEKTGSSRTNRIDQAMIAAQSISKTSILRAAQINEEVKAAMDELATLNTVFSCSLNSDYNFTNTSTNEYRYQAVFNIFY